MADFENINDAIRKNGVKNVTIIGGGFIGMELASAIKMTLKDKININVV
jgi:NADH dehydrogenase FAD-containing subunit